MAKYTKESILTLLQNLALELGKRSLTKQDVQPHIPVSSVSNYFGSLGNALEEAGLERGDSIAHLRDIHRRALIADNDLFRSLLDVERETGHEPGATEYTALGRYSVGPFRKRFGNWSNVMQHYRKWRAESVDHEATGNRLHPVVVASNLDVTDGETAIATNPPTRKRPEIPAQLYGEPIDFRGLRHAPINEQGVVYLFGMVSRELGFNVESVQQGFPDCEAKYLHDHRQNLWARARIEFEFRSSNFAQHGHDPTQCDFVVCWIHDWKDCPLEVIELRSELRKLPNR